MSGRGHLLGAAACTAALLLCSACGAVGCAADQGPATPAPRLLERARTLAASAVDDPLVRGRAHQLRNAEAMWELVSGLPPDRRPARILYLAAGSHLAPLVLCEALPTGSPCVVLLTEVEAGVQGPIDGLLGALAGDEVLSRLESTAPLTCSEGARTWRFRLNGHPVELTLRVSRPGPLVRPDDLQACDLVVSHDWSGDPLVNLRLIHEYLLGARGLERVPPPLMMEDLERHPYPIDLSLFVPLARTTSPYGHRTSDAGVGRHGSVELGPSLFGGGVVLGFADPWWRTVDPASLEDVLNFLVFNQFDNQRQNVLEGGDEPLLAPAMLDWWTDYGHRTLAGRDVREDTGVKERMLRAVAAVMPGLGPQLRQRMACRVALYRALLEARVGGVGTLSLMPAAEHVRRPEPGSLPSPEMERLYREALAQAELYRADQERERRESAELLETLGSTEWNDLAATCPELEGCPRVGDGDGWATIYRTLSEQLGRDQPVGVLLLPVAPSERSKGSAARADLHPAGREVPGSLQGNAGWGRSGRSRAGDCCGSACRAHHRGSRKTGEGLRFSAADHGDGCTATPLAARWRTC